MSDSASPIVRFGPFELDLRSGELRKNGSRVGLQDQTLQILSVLRERPGEMSGSIWTLDKVDR
jgi:DNA-binding winged helix-turn-helix (wHTH) protein